MCVCTVSNPEDESSSSGLSGGAIAGIIIGILVVFGIGAWYYWKNYYQPKNADEAKMIEIQTANTVEVKPELQQTDSEVP